MGSPSFTVSIRVIFPMEMARPVAASRVIVPVTSAICPDALLNLSSNPGSGWHSTELSLESSRRLKRVPSD